MTYPKIELHVHLEGTVRPGLLLRIARRNDVRLPRGAVCDADTHERLRDIGAAHDWGAVK
jgi:adenosine deaminase